MDSTRSARPAPRILLPGIGYFPTDFGAENSVTGVRKSEGHRHPRVGEWIQAGRISHIDNEADRLGATLLGARDAPDAADRSGAGFGIPRQAQAPLPDDVALDVRRAPGDGWAEGKEIVLQHAGGTVVFFVVPPLAGFHEAVGTQ